MMGSGIQSFADLIGKTVRIRRGPAAVNGDENHNNHWRKEAGSGRSIFLISDLCLRYREGMVSRSIREPENLPEACVKKIAGNEEFSLSTRIKLSWVQSLRFRRQESRDFFIFRPCMGNGKKGQVI
jgi:hypothetical protein